MPGGGAGAVRDQCNSFISAQLEDQKSRPLYDELDHVGLNPIKSLTWVMYRPLCLALHVGHELNHPSTVGAIAGEPTMGPINCHLCNL